MWGIGFKRTVNVQGRYLSVKDKIYEEQNTIKRYFVLFGFKIQIWEKEYISDIKIEDETKVGFKNG